MQDRGRVAAQLDGPAVECSIMLANIEEYAAALREPEQTQATLSEATPYLRFVTGYVLLMLERYSDALEHLKTVTEVRPDFASAHRYAAQCAFKLATRVREYAMPKQPVSWETLRSGWPGGTAYIPPAGGAALGHRRPDDGIP